MAYFKRIDKIITLSGSTRADANLRADIWSYDKDVSLFVFTLISKTGDAINLASANVTTYFKYTVDGVPTPMQASGKVESTANSQISFKVPEALKGYIGTVKGGVYVDLASGERIDIQNIQFQMKRSLIDDGSAIEPAKIYFESFEQTKASVEAAADKAIKEINASSKSVETIGIAAKTTIQGIVDGVNVVADDEKTKIKAVLPTLTAETAEVQTKIDDASRQIEDLVELKEAWAWSENGLENFMTQYPEKNLFPYTKFESMSGWSLLLGSSTGGATTSNNIATITKRDAIDSRAFLVNQAANDISLKAGATYSVSIEVYNESMINGDVALLIWFPKLDGTNDENSLNISNLEMNKWHTVKLENKFISDEMDVSKGINFSLAMWPNATGTLKIRKPKFELSESSTPYVPNSKEDYLNSFPHYSGINLLGGDNPKNYQKWRKTEEYLDYLLSLKVDVAAYDDLATRIASIEKGGTK